MSIDPLEKPIIVADTDSLTIIYGTRPEQYVSDDIYYSYASILADLGGPSIEDDDWILPEWGGTQHVGIHFSNHGEIISSENDLRLAKCFVVSVLSDNRSPQAGVNALKQLGMLYRFLHAKNYTIRMISTAVLRQYSDWLDRQDGLTDQKRNKLETLLDKFIPFCRHLGLLRPGNILLPQSRPVKEVKRLVPAPPKAVIHELDCYFFQGTNGIPGDIRAAYLLGRFVPTRTAEIVHTPLECMTLDDELAIISIPTRKETPGHIPEMEDYPVLPDGQYESILIRAVRDQQEYARSAQTIIKGKYRGYLMVSSANPKVLLTPAAINGYLHKVCDELDLRDANNDRVYVTFYGLRHTNGAEMLRDNNITRELTSSMFSHTRASTIDAYAYPAPDDAVSGAGEQVRIAKAMPITAGRLRKLQAQDGTRLVGTGAVCTASTCDPQYVRCWTDCPHFRPDPKYENDAKELLRQLENRMTKGNSFAEQTLRQQDAIKGYLAKLNIKTGDTNGTSD